ncbi:MAG: flagellar hook-basal body complex protein FliE [Roseburia sp.]
MDITSLTGISSDYINSIAEKNSLVNTSDDSFSSVLDSAINMLNETNDLQKEAESAEIQFALGEAENTHDLQIALQKANLALQYTVAVRDKMIDAYKEIMNMSV